MKLIRNNSYNNDIIFIDGHGGSGKSLISRVLECYKGVEKSKEDGIFYFILKLHEIGNISDDTAISLLKLSVDWILYYQTISRDINFRPSDVTSIFKYPYPLDYLKRIYRGERNIASEIIRREKPIFQNMTQNALISSRLLFDAFGDRIKIIYIKSNPIDIVYNMYSKGFGERIGKDPAEISLTFEYNGFPIPIFARNWPKLYLDSNPMDRIIMWISDETQDINQSYKLLNNHQKKQILFINFEDFVTTPYGPYTDLLEAFIGRKKIFKIKRILKKERCPRILDTDSLDNKKDYILSKSSERCVDIFKKLIGDYDRNL